MTDTDERAAMLAQAKEREYTVGWRAYRDGKPCPAGKYAAAGWRDAQYAVEQVGRWIGWSAAIAGDDWILDEPCGWQRAVTDFDRAPG